MEMDMNLDDAIIVADNIGQFIIDSYIMGYMNLIIENIPSKIRIKYGC
jgi:hypothetical protein